MFRGMYKIMSLKLGVRIHTCNLGTEGAMTGGPGGSGTCQRQKQVDF